MSALAFFFVSGGTLTRLSHVQFFTKFQTLNFVHLFLFSKLFCMSCAGWNCFIFTTNMIHYEKICHMFTDHDDVHARSILFFFRLDRMISYLAPILLKMKRHVALYVFLQLPKSDFLTIFSLFDISPTCGIFVPAT